MLRFAALFFALFLSGVALADEGQGCGGFAWGLDKERQLLAKPDEYKAGSILDRAMPSAVNLKLSPLAEAKLPKPPERAPKDPSSFAGIISFGPAPVGGNYQITLSEAAWIDVIQGDSYLKPLAFTGAKGCPGMRKSVRFALGAAPFIVQLSGVAANEIAIIITPAN